MSAWIVVMDHVHWFRGYADGGEQGLGYLNLAGQVTLLHEVIPALILLRIIAISTCEWILPQRSQAQTTAYLTACILIDIPQQAATLCSVGLRAEQDH